MPRPILSHRRSDRGDRSAHETNRSATVISKRATLPPRPARLRKQLAKAVRDWSRLEQVAGERICMVSLVNDAGIQMHRVPASFREQLHRRNKRLPEGALPGPRGQCRFRGRAPNRYNTGRFSRSAAISPPQIGMQGAGQLILVRSRRRERSFQRLLRSADNHQAEMKDAGGTINKPMTTNSGTRIMKTERTDTRRPSSQRVGFSWLREHGRAECKKLKREIDTIAAHAAANDCINERFSEAAFALHNRECFRWSSQNHLRFR